MRRAWASIPWLIALGAVTVGCATILCGTKEDFAVKTESAPVLVTLMEGDVVVAEGQAPWTVSVPRGPTNMTLVIAKEGCNELRLPLLRRANLWVLGNVLVGGVVGVVVDWATGAIYRYDLGVAQDKAGCVHIRLIRDVGFDTIVVE